MSLLPTYVFVEGTPSFPLSDFNIYLQKGKLIDIPESKNVFTHEWMDSSKVETIIPANITFKSYDVTLNFAYVGEPNSFNEKIRAFIQRMGAGKIGIFDVWQRTGMILLYKKYNQESMYRRERDIFEFSMTFTNIEPLSYGLYFESAQTWSGEASQPFVVYLKDGTKEEYSNGSAVSKNFSQGEFIIISPELIEPIFK